jgi:hypothetical protein
MADSSSHVIPRNEAANNHHRAPGISPVQILDRLAYIDTVKIWADYWIPTTVCGELQRLCHAKSWPIYEPMKFGSNWRSAMKLHRPTDAAFAFLDSLPCELMITQVHVSLDLVVANAWAAEKLKNWTSKFWVKRWPGNRRSRAYATTQYCGTRRSANTLVAYANLPSKLGPPNVGHLEWRMQTAGAVRAAGIATPWDLVDFDFRTFWQTHLILEEVDFGKLSRLRPKIKRRRALPDDEAVGRRMARFVSAWANSGRPYCATQDLREHSQTRLGIAPARLSRCLRRLENGEFLPE